MDRSYFPLDVWTEILMRIPAENLIQLQRVCKSWRELIRDRTFVEAHRDLHRSRINGFLVKTCGEQKTRGLYYLSSGTKEGDGVQLRRLHHLKPPFRVHDSCDGWLLISGLAAACGQLTLYNCVTGSVKILPELEPDRGGIWDWMIVRDASNNRVKVLGLYHGDRNKVLELIHGFELPRRWNRITKLKCILLEVRRGKKGSSRKELTLPQCLAMVCRTGAKSNGGLYWLVQGFIGPSGRGRTGLLYLDLAKEKFEIKVLPRRDTMGHPFVSDGAFHCTSSPSGENEVELWVLKDPDGQPAWFKHHVIRSDPSITGFSTMEGFRSLEVLALLGTKLISISKAERKIVVYDLSSMKWTFAVLDEDEGERDWKYECFDRLISLN